MTGTKQADDHDEAVQALIRSLLVGDLQEALEAVQDPRIPEWALKRAKDRRKEPGLQRVLAEIERDGGSVATRRMLERKAEQDANRAAFVAQSVVRIKATLSQGRTPYLHSVTFVSSSFSLDGVMHGAPPQMLTINEFGLDGWETVATLPRTNGYSLTNAQGRSVSYGGGIGGLVDGVYVIMRYAVSQEMVETRLEELQAMLIAIFDGQVSGQTQTPAQVRINQGTVAAPQAAQAQGSRGPSMGFAISHVFVHGEDEGGDFGE